MNYAADAPLQLRADGDHEAVAAYGDEIFLCGAFRCELAQGGAQGFFNLFFLALLLTADASQFGRGIVGQRTVGLDGAFDRLGQRAQAAGKRRRKLG